MKGAVMVDVNWDEPPAKRGGNATGRRGKYDAVFKALQADPGRWAKVGNRRPSASQGTWLRKRYPGFDVKGASSEVDGLYTFWARWPLEAAARVEAAYQPRGRAAPVEPVYASMDEWEAAIKAKNRALGIIR